MGPASKLLLAAVVAVFCASLTGDLAAQQKRSSRPAAASNSAEPQGDAQLRSKVEQLEEQLTDMQVTVGTLESLGRGGNAGGGVRAGGGVDNARIDSLETQIRALASQVQQLSDQVRQLSGGRRGEALPPIGSGGFAAAPPSYPQSQGSARPSAAPTAIQGFGSTTINPGGSDPIGNLLSTDQPQKASARPATPLPPQAASAANPRALYETAYGYLLQQDYGAAEVSFDEFLRRFPDDRLAADAQYWLGETLYVQRRYKPAGQAFLGVIEKHKDSAKVPHSLLKLAQSLEQLGQKDCGIFAEIDRLKDRSPADVRVRARALKQRQGC